ncbi:MAG: T9SS type A sorting domain-containing protein [Flavobacterium sp.]
MKIKLRNILLWCVLFTLNIYAQNPQKKVLFVGNSMTYFNDMPLLFGDIANSKGKTVDAQSYTVGGSGFINHVVDNNLYSVFRNTIWDVVVLQPGTGESAGTTSSVNATIQRGQILMDSIKKYSPCARVMLYQIPYGVPSAETYNTYFTVQTQIRDSITKMADSLHVPFVPTGECARMHYTAQQDLLLHGSYNDIHPNLNGSYLVASAMYAAIFQEPVSGTTSYGGIPQATAEYFHNIVDQVVLPNKAQWRINTYNLHANFNAVVNTNSITFINNSTNFTSVEWDFGDATTSTEINPTHTFSSGGIKTIKLKVIQNNCEEIIEKQIDLDVLGVSDFQKTSFLMYPNPVNSVLSISCPSASSVSIVNSIGQKIYINSEKKTAWQINVSTFSDGIYFIIFDNQSVHKFVKN